MRRWLRRAVLSAALVSASVGAWAQLGGGKEAEKGVLASLISRALSTPSTRVSIGDVEGALSSDATVRDIQISDRDGVWLRLDRARIVWSRLALLQRRLEIDRLEVGTLDVARRPIPAEAPVAGEDEPLLPQLPVKVNVKVFSLGELRLGEALIGTPARLAAGGSARLGNDPSEGLDLTFDARRLDAPGTFMARLGLVPQGQRLTLTLKLDEPARGIAARAAGIPGLPPVLLDVDGSGTLDAFAARLAFKAGDGIGADGTAQLDRQGALRRLGLDLAARIEGLLPAVAAPVFAGTTKLTGSAEFGDDGAIALRGLDLEAAAARLTIAGTLDRDRRADVTLAARNLPNAGGTTATGGAEIRRLALDAHLTGPLTGPDLDATLSAEDARLPAGRLGGLRARFKASPRGKDLDNTTILAIDGDLAATGLAPSDAAVARAIGDRLTLALRGTATTKGVIEVETLTAATPTQSVRYAGRLGSDELRGRLGLEAGSLAPFGGLAGRPLAGAVTATADLEGTPRASRYVAAIDGTVRGFSAGIPAVDGLFGGRIALAGGIRVEPTGGFVFDGLKLTGEAVSAEVSGPLLPDSADLAVTASLPDLHRVDARLTGRAALTGRVTGGLAHPNVTAEATITDATALGRAVPRLALSADVKDATGALDGTVRLDGTVDGKPARAAAHVTRPAAGGYGLDGLDLLIGSVKANGALALDSDGLAAGRVTVDAPNLDDLSPLLLSRASGSLAADLAATRDGGGQGAVVKARADRVSVYGLSLTRADADLTLVDIWRRPAVSGRVRVDEASLGGEQVSRLRLTATGAPQASDVTLTATARGFDLDAKARIVPGDRTRIEVSQLGASRDTQRLALAGPATLTLVPGGVELRGVAFGFGAGRLTLDGEAGSRLDLRAEARAVPLSAADIVSPGLGLSGTLNGEARITGTPSAPTGDIRARIDDLATAATRNLGLPRIGATATARLTGGRASLDATVSAGSAGSLRATGSVPIGGAGALDVAVKGRIDAGAASAAFLAPSGRRLTGQVDVDARVGGTIAAPQASGAASLAGGTFSDAGQGVELTGLRGRLVARGSDVTLEGVAATTRNGGTITAAGRIRIDPEAGFPGDIKVTGRNAELVRSSLATAVANLDIGLSGPLARDPRVAGRVDLVQVDVRVPDNLGGSLKPLANTRHRNPTRTTRARLALDAKPKGKGGRAAPPFDAQLDLTLNAPSQIYVRGRGLNAELGGNLRLTGTLAKPVPNGAFELRRGTFQIGSVELDFSRGRLAFTGDMTPELDFTANANAGGAAIQIAVTGPADNPAFAFTSSPDLPQDEVLSRLLFNSPSGQLSPFQALSLAQTAAQFSGGDDAFEGARRSLGLSGLDVGLGTGGGLGVGLQRALGSRVSVGIKAGSGAASTGVGIDVRVTDQLRLQGEFGAGGSSAGIGYQYEW